MNDYNDPNLTIEQRKELVRRELEIIEKEIELRALKQIQEELLKKENI